MEDPAYTKLLERAVLATAIDQAFITTDFSGHITSWSAGARHVFGWLESEVLGTHIGLIFPAPDVAAGAPQAELQEALRRGRCADERWYQKKSGMRFWGHGELRPLCHEGAAGFLKIVRDRTQERAAHEALHASDTLKGAVLEAALDGIITVDAASRVLDWNGAAERIFGYPRQTAVGRDLAELIIPDELRKAHREGMARYLSTGHGPLLDRRVEVEAVRADGSRFPVELAISPILVGESVHFTARLRDISERKRQEAALRESELRFRHLADSAPALIWLTDEAGRLIFGNRHFEHFFGHAAASFVPRGWRDLVHPEDLTPFRREFMSAFQARRPFTTRVRALNKHGETLWFRAEGVPRIGDRGEFLGYTGLAVDVTTVRAAQEQQALLINELNHRVKNTLATVQSIVAQTLKGAGFPPQARKDIEARLIALSRAHDVLTRENWGNAGLREVVVQAIEPFDAGTKPRFNVVGPDVRVSPRVSLALAMILQELATNAVKYGALSTDIGQVLISWRDEGDARLRRLHLSWAEQGGPAISGVPSKRGFGTTLIERSVAYEFNGKATLRFEPSGLVCEMDAHLPFSAAGQQ